MSADLFSDMAKVTTELSRRREFEHLSDLLQSAAKVSACVADLRVAAESLATLEELMGSPRGLNRPSRRMTEFALLATAVNFYVRATALAARRGERGCSNIEKQLDEDQLADHRSIVAIRHLGLTHVTPNVEVDDDIVWYEQWPLAFQLEEGWKIGFATRHVQFRQKLYEQLARQTPVAIRILDDRLQARISRFGREFDKVPGGESLLRRHALDPTAVFGSEAAAKQAIAPLREGGLTTTFFTVGPR
ncbi:MAG TPA: hypothetical protein VF702_05400 [Allosphingosinicella sp.]